MDHDNEYDQVRPCLTPCQTPCFAGKAVGCAAQRSILLSVEDPAHPEPNPTESSQRLSTQQLMDEAVVAMAVEVTAHMFGLRRATVAEIVATGLPMIASMSEGNPDLRRRLYVSSVVRLPERIEDFYARIMASQYVRQAVMDDYRATYGAMLDAVNRMAARQAGTTDGQARDVIAAALPAVTQVLGNINRAGDEQSFCQRLRDLHA